jgi:hypothetical protein
MFNTDLLLKLTAVIAVAISLIISIQLRMEVEDVKNVVLQRQQCIIR